MFTIMANGTRKRHGRIHDTLTAVGRVTHRGRRPIALGSGLVVRQGRSCSYFKSFRCSLFQNPGRHLGRGYDDSGLVVAVPPCIIIINSWVYGNNTFPAVVARRAECRGFFGPPGRTGKTSRTFLIPPHPMIRAPRADGAVYARSLCLPRLERSRIAEREVRIPSSGAISARRAGLHM